MTMRIVWISKVCYSTNGLSIFSIRPPIRHRKTFQNTSLHWFQKIKLRLRHKWVINVSNMLVVQRKNDFNVPGLNGEKIAFKLSPFLTFWRTFKNSYPDQDKILATFVVYFITPFATLNVCAMASKGQWFKAEGSSK